jgi:hypothetical protein
MPKLTKKQEIVKKLILWLRDQGITLDDPYDFQNFIADNCNHSQLFALGVFDESDNE